MENETKKAAFSATTPKADKATKATNLNNILPQKEHSVKREMMEELATIFSELTPERKHYLIDWTKLYIKDKGFRKAFEAWFDKNKETAYFEDCVQFIADWKEVCA